MMFGITEPTGSHLPLLEQAARNATGLVVEHGAGLYSTPLLARLGCKVLCCEPNAGWREWASWIYDGRGELVESLRSVIPRLADASLVFIDGPANERGELLNACLSAAVPCIVAHDTHPRCWAENGWTGQHFTPAGYTVTHDEFKRKYRTTLWQR